MRRTTAETPATTPIPVPRSDREFAALIFPPLAMPKRGPQCPLGDHGVLNLIGWVLSTGRPGKCWPIPPDAHGQPAIHDPTVDKVFAPWADDGSRWHACGARVAPRADAKKLDLRVRQGDGTNPVAQKGGRGWGPRVTNTSRARTSSRERTTRARGELPFLWHPSRRRLWSCGRRG